MLLQELQSQVMLWKINVILVIRKSIQKALHKWWELLKTSMISPFMHKNSDASGEKKQNSLTCASAWVKKAWWENRQGDKEHAINLSHREMGRLSAGYHRWYMTYYRMIRLLHTNKHNRTHTGKTHTHTWHITTQGHHSQSSPTYNNRMNAHNKGMPHTDSHACTLSHIVAPCSNDFTSNK